MTEEKKMDKAEQLEKEELPEEKLDEVAGGILVRSGFVVEDAATKKDPPLYSAIYPV